MENLQRQKKLTFVLQLLEDLHHLHRSNIHKCDCEICDKKYSLIDSSIAKATEEVGQVSLSLVSDIHGGLCEAAKGLKFSAVSTDHRVRGHFQKAEESPPLFSRMDENDKAALSNCDEKQTAEELYLLNKDSESIPVSELHRNQAPNFHASQSLLSSTQRDSGVHCENLLHLHSISPIRSMDDVSPNCSVPSIPIASATNPSSPCEFNRKQDTSVSRLGNVNVKQTDHPHLLTKESATTESIALSNWFVSDPPMKTSHSSTNSPSDVSPTCHQFSAFPCIGSRQGTSPPAFGQIPAAFYPLSIVSNMNIKNIQSPSQHKQAEILHGPLSRCLEISHRQTESNFISQGENATEPCDDKNVASATALLSNMYVSTPRQNETEKRDLSMSDGERKDCRNDASQRLSVLNVANRSVECLTTRATVGSHVKNVTDFYNDDSIVHGKNVLLSDARLLSEEDLPKNGDSRCNTNSVMENSRLSDSSMWRPWEVKEDIYRILSDSSIGEEDDVSGDDKEISLTGQGQHQFECVEKGFGLEKECNDEVSNDIVEKDAVGKESSLSGHESECFEKGFILKKEDKGMVNCDANTTKEVNTKKGSHPLLTGVKDSVSQSLLMSPCKKKRRNRNENPVHCGNSRSDSSDRSLGEMGIGHAGIKSPCKKVHRNTSGFESASEVSELDSFDVGREEGDAPRLLVNEFSPPQRNEELELVKGSPTNGLDSVSEGCTKSDAGHSPKTIHLRKSKCRQTLFTSSETKENRDISSSASSPSRIDQSGVIQEGTMKDMSNNARNQRNLLGEVNEVIEDKSNFEMKIFSRKQDGISHPPEIVVTSVDSVELDGTFGLNKIVKDLDYIKRSEKENAVKDKSILDLLISKKDSHSFCSIPNHHKHNLDVSKAADFKSWSKTGRVVAKTFPPKHKSKQVFVTSSQVSTHNSHDEQAPEKFPVMGVSGTSNKVQNLQAQNKKNVKIPSAECEHGCGSTDDLINEIDEEVSYFQSGNEKDECVGIQGLTSNQPNMEKKSVKDQVKCQGSCYDDLTDHNHNDDKKYDVKVFGTFDELPIGIKPAWGAPAIWNVPNCAKEVEEDLNESLADIYEGEGDMPGRAGEDEIGAEEYPETRLWKQFGKLHLNENKASSLNRSLPVVKTSKCEQPGQGPQCGRDELALESFEANQSFPRMAQGQRLNDLTATVSAANAGRTAGVQNLGLGDIHQKTNTSSTLRDTDRPLTPRNRRSIFGFSPPCVNPKPARAEKLNQVQDDGNDSAVASNSKHQCLGSRQQSGMMSPPQLLDKMWADFDMSECFCRPPLLEEVLFNCVTSCVCVVDARMQGKIVSVNEAFQQLVGIHEKILGLKLSRFIKVKPSSAKTVSSPQQIVLSDGTLTPISGKVASCITDRGGQLPVSLWFVPSHSLANNDDDVKLWVCIIEPVLPLPNGFYLTPDREIFFDDSATSNEIESLSLVPCHWTMNTALLVVDSNGMVDSWDRHFFAHCHIEEKTPLSSYLTDVVKISDFNDSTTDSSSSLRHHDRQSPAVSGASGDGSSPSLRNHILSRFGGDVSLLKESAVLWGDASDDDSPGLVLPAKCFLMGYDHDDVGDSDENDDDEEEEDILLAGDGIRKDTRRLKRQEKSFSEEAAAAECLKHVHGSLCKPGALPTTSTPCKGEGQVVAHSELSAGRPSCDDNNDRDGEFFELDKGIFLAKFHYNRQEYVDVTFKLGKVVTVENGTLFCLWFSIQDSTEEDFEDCPEHCGVEEASGDTIDSFSDGSDGNKSFTNNGGKPNGCPSQKQLEQIRHEAAKEIKKTDISLGQFITDQAGLNQSHNATVDEDTLDLEHAVLGSFSDNYRILETLGQGSFGFVRRAFPLTQENNSVVVKFIKKSSMLEDSWQWQTSTEQQIPVEVAILKMLDHHNIVKLLDVHQNEQFVQLVMEDFASLDLFDFIDQVSIDEMLACYIFKQIVQAVNYLHSNSILHRDIKDENVIINSSFHCKLIDFGSATYFLPPGQVFDKFRGTLEYCSPEVHLHQSYRGPELDAWALGVTLYTIVFRENPYQADAMPSQMDANDLPWPVHHDLTVVLFGLMCCDPCKRFSVAKALGCPWLKQELDSPPHNWDDLFPEPDYRDY